MKKRILSSFVAVLMLLTLLPSTAMAGGIDEPTIEGWKNFKAAVKGGTMETVKLQYCSFDWPTESDTLYVNRPILMDSSDGGASWTVPSNITMVFSGGAKISGWAEEQSLTVHGTVENNSDEWFRLLDGPGENRVTITGDCNVDGTCVIVDDSTWNLTKPGRLGSVQLDGTLTGSGGTVEGQVIVNNRYMEYGDGHELPATLSGDLTLNGGLNVGFYIDDEKKDDLTISEGSRIVNNGYFHLHKNSILYLNGELVLSGSDNQINGTIILGPNGVLTLEHDIFKNSDNNDAKITGEGTIQFDLTKPPYLFDKNMVEIYYDRQNNSEAHSDIIATTVTLEPTSSSGGSGGDISGGELQKLQAPTDLQWNRYYLVHDAVAGKYFDYNGMISWVEDTAQPEHWAEVQVYKKNDSNAVFSTQWLVRQNGYSHRTDWDFSLSVVDNLESGEYYFTVQDLGDGKTTSDSDIVTSPDWSYTKPGSSLSTPDGLTWDGSTAKWNEATDPLAGGYAVDVYYSPDNGNAQTTEGLKMINAFVWYFDEGNKNSFYTLPEYDLEENGSGYYYFTVKTVSDDINQKMHSAFSGISPAYYYNASDVEQSVPAVTDASFRQDQSGSQTYLHFDFAADAELSNIQPLEIQLYQDGDWQTLDTISPQQSRDFLLENLLEGSSLSGTFTKIKFISHGANGYGDSTYETDINLTIRRETNSNYPASAVYTQNASDKYDVTVSGLTDGKPFSVATMSAADYDSTQVLVSLGFTAAEGTTAQFANQSPMADITGAYYRISEYESTLTDSNTLSVTITDVSGWKRCFPNAALLPEQEVGWTVGSITWTYGEVNAAQNTAYNDSEGGSSLTYTSSDPTVATVDEDGKATLVGAGTTEITATAAAVPGKYAETSVSYTLIINQAPLTITAKDNGITYGEAPANNGWMADGFKYSDGAEAVTGTAAYAYTYEQFDKAGTYEISVSGLSAKNYEITYNPGVLTVNRAVDYTITLGNLNQTNKEITPVTAAITPKDNTAQIKVQYQVGEQWTDTLPTEVGKYAVRASLTSSENIIPKDTYAEGTLTIAPSASVGGVDVSVEVGDGKAEITMTPDELEQITESAAGEVNLALPTVEGVKELTLPGGLVDSLSKSSNADSLTVSTADSTIFMSGSVLDTVASAVKSSEDKVSVKLTAVEKDDLNEDQKAALNSIAQDAVIMDVSMVVSHTDNTATELHQLGGNAKITVPYEGAVPTGKYIVVCYLSSDGNVSYVRATYNAETKQVSFTTNHFSNYAVFVSDDPVVVVDGGSGSGTYAEGAPVTIVADSKSGYTFAGWEVLSGNVTLANAKASETTFIMPAGAVELKATYARKSGGGGGSILPSYAVNGNSTKDGQVTIDRKNAFKGDTVTITVKPDDGYMLDKLIVTDKDGNEISLKDKGNGEFTFTMPSSKITIEAKFIPVEQENTPTVMPSTHPFNDIVSGTWIDRAVQYVYANGLMAGITKTDFAPNEATNRAMIWSILARKSGADTTGSGRYWYLKGQQWAVEMGVSDGTNPTAPITREQLVVMLWRSVGCPVGTDNLSAYKDGNAISDYAVTAMQWAIEKGLISGNGDGTLAPKAGATRAETASILMRFCESDESIL